MVIDAWEHPCYLRYRSRKDEFFNAVRNPRNWRDVGAHVDAATRLDLLLAGAV